MTVADVKLVDTTNNSRVDKTSIHALVRCLESQHASSSFNPHHPPDPPTRILSHAHTRTPAHPTPVK
eukprot:1287188-Prorocentrum_lima.AAC.1